MSKHNAQLFFTDSESDSDAYDPNDTALPFPKPLDRSAFLDPSFSAATFLETLQNRFQTLEDLQQELHDLVRGLNKELVDLVNDNYTDFLSLGEKLKGGEQRIEEVRVGLMGFQRDVVGVRDTVQERSEQISTALAEKRALRKDIRLGRTLLEVDERLEVLEGNLSLGQRNDVVQQDGPPYVSEDETTIGDFNDWDDIWTAEQPHEFDSHSSDGEDDESKTDDNIPRRLRRQLELFQIIQLLSQRCGEQHPFLLAQRDRISSIKDTLSKELEAVIRSEPNLKDKQKLLQIRSSLNE